MRTKILIVDKVNDVLPERLKNAGHEIVLAQSLSKQEVVKIIKDFTGIIIRSRFKITPEIIDSGINLTFIARLGSGMESIDVEYCRKKNIICINSPEGNRDSVGEHCMGMLLSLLNNLNKADKEVKNGIWLREENRGIEIIGKTVGIIGYGNTGSRFARKLSGFECEVIAYDKYKKNYQDGYTSEVSMTEIFNEAEVLSLHVPLTEETKYMFNKAYINNFKKSFIFINSSRGPVVNTSDLVAAIKEKKIIGAALDVIEYEETSFEKTKNLKAHSDFCYLAKCDNVILSPHIAGWTHESDYKLASILADKILNLKL